MRHTSVFRAFSALLAFDAGYAWPQNNLRDLFYQSHCFYQYSGFEQDSHVVQ